MTLARKKSNISFRGFYLYPMVPDPKVTINCQTPTPTRDW
jgi:hypothetical protein